MLKQAFIFTLILVGFCPCVYADDCKDRFAKFLTDRPDQTPVKIHVTQAVDGGMEMKNYNYQLSGDHWMSEMISPATMQWTLVHNNVMYSSSDKGKSWKKVREMNSAQNKSASQARLNDAAATIENAVCGQEELNGVPHDVVEADYAYPALQTKHHEKIWVNPKTGWISKSVMRTVHSAYASTTTQLLEPAPELALPKP